MSILTMLAKRKSAEWEAAEEATEHDAPGKQHEAIEFKTLPGVKGKLPHKQPRTEAHLKANLAHLRKLSANNKQQIEHHEFERHWYQRFHEKILPRWHALGYTANAKSDIATAKKSVQFHAAKALHYTQLQAKTQAAIAVHKHQLKQLAKPAIKTKRPLKVTLPAKPLQVAAANFPIIKDTNYYKNLGHLLHLKIDRDAAQTAFTNKTEPLSSRAYMAAYKAHPLYTRMNKYLKRAARIAAKVMHPHNRPVVAKELI